MGLELEKYKSGGASKYTCPKCERRKCFTKYCNTQTGEYIDNLVGICDHRNSCGYHLSPREFFEMNPDRKDEKYNNDDFFDKDRVKEIIPIKSIPKEHILKLIGLSSNFLIFLKSKFPKDVVRKAIFDYMICGFGDGKVVFNQIDSQGRVRAGKLMQYDAVSGKRYREDSVSFKDACSKVSFSPPVDWIHRYLKKDGLLPKDWKMRQCLFGEHLHTKYPLKRIAIVESEKTAIIMSCFYPEYNWMATGGLKSLSAQKIYPIKSFEIMAFPDFGCCEEWSEKADKINKEIGSKIFVSKSFEEIAKKMNLDKGLDIADMFLNLDSDEFAKQFNKATNESP